MSLQYQRFTNIERVPSVTIFTHLIHCPISTLCVCSLQRPRFTHLLHVIHCVFPSTPTFSTPATCHTLRVPFDTHVLHTCYMSYTACSLRHPRFTHLLHVIHCVFPSTPTCDCSAQQLRQQLRGTLVATQWRGDTVLINISVVLAAVHDILGFPGWSPRSSHPSFFPFPLLSPCPRP